MIKLNSFVEMPIQPAIQMTPSVADESAAQVSSSAAGSGFSDVQESILEANTKSINAITFTSPESRANVAPAETNSSANSSVNGIINYNNFVDDLYNEGLIQHLPEGINDIPDMDTLKKVVTYAIKNRDAQTTNNNRQSETQFMEMIQSKLHPVLQELMTLNLNNKDLDIINVAKSIIQTQDISQLDNTDPQDQLKIVSRYLAEVKTDKDAVEDELELLRDNPTKLSERAQKYKPKLEQLILKKAQDQIDIQNLMKAQEGAQKTHLLERTQKILQTGNIFGVPINQELATWLTAASVDDIQFNMNGKETMMPYFEALSHFHKYSKDGDPRVVLGAMLFMKDPNLFIESLKKDSVKEVIKELKGSSVTPRGSLFEKRDVVPAKLSKNIGLLA